MTVLSIGPRQKSRSTCVSGEIVSAIGTIISLFVPLMLDPIANSTHGSDFDNKTNSELLGTRVPSRFWTGHNAQLTVVVHKYNRKHSESLALIGFSDAFHRIEFHQERRMKTTQPRWHGHRHSYWRRPRRTVTALTISRPKPAVHSAGCFRIIDFTLSNCCIPVSVAFRFLPVSTPRSFTVTSDGDGMTFGNSASATRSPWFAETPVSAKGIGGYRRRRRFRNAEVLDDESDFVLILSGDHIYQMDYGDLLKQHLENDADLRSPPSSIRYVTHTHFGVV
jgi:hypothetical protein